MSRPKSGQPPALERVDEVTWRIARDERRGMRTDGIVYADETLVAVGIGVIVAVGIGVAVGMGVTSATAPTVSEPASSFQS